MYCSILSAPNTLKKFQKNHFSYLSLFVIFLVLKASKEAR
jgi:hypothetical protein